MWFVTVISTFFIASSTAYMIFWTLYSGYLRNVYIVVSQVRVRWILVNSNGVLVQTSASWSWTGLSSLFTVQSFLCAVAKRIVCIEARNWCKSFKFIYAFLRLASQHFIKAIKNDWVKKISLISVLCFVSNFLNATFWFVRNLTLIRGISSKNNSFFCTALKWNTSSDRRGFKR